LNGGEPDSGDLLCGLAGGLGVKELGVGEFFFGGEVFGDRCTHAVQCVLEAGLGLGFALLDAVATPVGVGHGDDALLLCLLDD
jgi:hypothetical protein